jgi:GNAT superfamily N-acetyltransferase
MLRLRAAVESDLADIFELIGLLADYERLRDQMVGSIEDLRRHLFAEPRYAHVVMAHWDGRVAGFALYFFNYSTFLCRPGLYLEDLFVHPEFRGRGVGRQLLAELERRARAAGCGRFE